MDTTTQGGRNLRLDLLKLIACTAVVGLHIYIKNGAPVFRVLYYLCTIGVPVFFMCSGYLLLDRRSFSPGYITRKLLAIARIAVLWSLIASAVKAGGLLLQGQSLDAGPLRFVLRVLVLGLQDQGVMFALWYLGALFLLYLTLPFVSRLLRGTDGHTSPRRMLLLWGVLAAGILISRVVSLHIGRMLQNRVWLTYRLWTYWQYLLLGGLMKQLLPRLERRLTLPLQLALTATLSGAAAAEFVWIKACLIENAWASTAYDSLAMILWTASLFTLILRLPLGTRAGSVIRFLGPLTMGVYLVHPILMAVCDALLPVSGAAVLLYYVGILLASFAAAWLLRRLPGGRYLTAL